MKIILVIFFTIFSQSIFAQQKVAFFSLNEVEKLPVFHQIEMQASNPKNQVALFQAKLQQFLFIAIDPKNLACFEKKSPINLDLFTTIDAKLKIANSVDFTDLQLNLLKNALEKLSIAKAAQKNGEDVVVSFSLSLLFTYTEIKTIK